MERTDLDYTNTLAEYLEHFKKDSPVSSTSESLLLTVRACSVYQPAPSARPGSSLCPRTRARPSNTSDEMCRARNTVSQGTRLKINLKN